MDELRERRDLACSELKDRGWSDRELDNFFDVHGVTLEDVVCALEEEVSKCVL